MSTETLKLRANVEPGDCWDLSSLYADNEAWEADFQKLDGLIATFETYRGRLDESPEVLAEALTFDSDFDRTAERLGTFAFLKTTEDQGNSDFQGMKARYQNLAVRASQAASFMRPELLAIDEQRITELIKDDALSLFRLQLERVFRYRPHTLTDNEERLLAMQGEMASAAGNAFRQLNDADLRFGDVEDHEGRTVELSHATFGQLLISPERKVRKNAFDQYYTQFSSHENTLAATLREAFSETSIMPALVTMRAACRRHSFPTTFRSMSTTI